MSKNNITQSLWIHFFVKKCQHQTPRQELKKINVWFVRLTLCCDSVGISQKQRVHSWLFAWHLTLSLLALHLSQPSGIHKSYAADRSGRHLLRLCSVQLHCCWVVLNSIGCSICGLSMKLTLIKNIELIMLTPVNQRFFRCRTWCCVLVDLMPHMSQDCLPVYQWIIICSNWMKKRNIFTVLFMKV